MNPISFQDENKGSQVGINYGSINYQYVQQENKRQNTDRGVLRSLSFPEMLDRRDNIAPCHTDTCRWILDLDDFKNWEIQSRGLLWIKGKPGAGKSTLMAFLYNQLNESQELQELQQPPSMDRRIRLDFFFSARGTELQHTPLGMLRSLLNQLYGFDETVRPPVRKIFEDRCRQYGYGENHWQWTQVKLEELVADAILESAKQQQVMVFVDALDEAGAESAQHLASYFHRLTSRAKEMEAAVKVCISCRHYPIVKDPQAVDIIVEAHNHDDIASYIKNAFVGAAAGENQQELKDLTEHLIRQADGVFQWIQLLVPDIKRRIDESESFDEIYSWLREVPAGLEQIYVYIINHVIVKHNLKQSLLLFQWVCLAEQPLTVEQMRYALATENIQISFSKESVPQISTSPKSLESTRQFIDNDDRMKTRIKVLSGGLAEVVLNGKDKEVVQVVHQSVNDFLCTKGFELLSSHITAKAPSLDSEEIVLQCHATLYRSCLISVASYAQVWETMKDPIREPGDIASEILRKAGDTFFYYATDFLFSHAKKAAECRLGILKNEVDLLHSIIEAWIQFHMRMRRSPSDDLGHPTFEHGTALLHVAAAYDLVDIIEILLDGIEHVGTRDLLGQTPIHFASQHGHTRAVKLLCERGASCKARDDYGRTALTRAARHGNLELFEWLLHEEAITGICDNRDEALQASAAQGHTRMVQILLNDHVDVNSQGGEYGNPLQAAAYSGHVEVVRILLDASADVNAEGGPYGKALEAAAGGGDVEVVQMLLDAHTHINIQEGEHGKALQAAAGGVHPEVVQMLLDAYADFHTQASEYGSALRVAAFVGHSEVLRMLLDAHADVNAQGGEYGSALQEAARGGNSEVLRMLLDAHADVNAQGGEYGSALQAAAHYGRSEVIQMLLDAHADVNAQGGPYGNALQAAGCRGHYEVVQMLLNANADVNAQGGEYGSALQAAACTGYSKMVQMLLDANVDVNAQGGRYGNALQAAVHYGHSEVIQMLLDAHADVNAQGGPYGNALQAATVEGQTDAVRILLDAHANVNAQGGQYENALQAATVEGWTDIMRILLDAGANINAQDGKYRSVILAAVGPSPKYPDTIQFPLAAEAHLLVLDELDQSPLHIAVSSSSALSRLINVISHFPFLASALDNRDKLLRTPLHAAIYRGRTPSSAIKLLNLGADPSILDGYGRNIMDWINGSRYWMGRIQPHCSQILLTPHETQCLIVRQSVFLLAETIFDFLPKLQLPLVRQLGHFLLSLKDEDRATYLFQLYLSRETGLFGTKCSECDIWIYGPILVCRKCPGLIQCSAYCITGGGPPSLHSFDHQTFKVSVPCDEKRQYKSTIKELGLFLQDLMIEYSAASASEPKGVFLNPSSSSGAQETTALLSSKTIFGPGSIACIVLFGVFGLLFRYHYFEFCQDGSF